jgi:conjugative relaxase-like TrwC/TraI family protein
MLSLAKIGRGREDYHLRAVGADASTYYSEHGEVAGRWLGGGAAALSLEGRVEDPALLAVLAGCSPSGTTQLVAPPRTGRRMPGIDACFKAPKSVSLLWAFGNQVTVGSGTLDRVVGRSYST